MADTKQGFGAGGGATAPNRVYEDFDPHLEWAKDESFDTLLVYLPGFPKDKLKIQITSSGKLRLSGERPVTQNKWRRFLKELPLSPDCDTNKISAKFEGGILYVKVPKPLSTTTTASPNPKVPPTRPTTTTTTTTTTDHDHGENLKTKPKPKPKPTTSPDSRLPPATGDQSDRKPAQKQQEQAPSKPASSSLETVPPNNDASTFAASGWGKASEKAKAAGSGGEGDRKSGEKSGSGSVGVVKRTTSLIGDQYKKVMVISTQGNPRVLINMLLAVLFVGVLALYAKNILIRSFGKSNGSDHHHHHHDHEL